MALIARDPQAPYLLLTDVMRSGKHKGVEIGDIIADVPDYLQWLVDNGYAAIGGEVADALSLATIKAENRERDASDYDADADTWLSQFDRADDDSIVDYLD